MDTLAYAIKHRWPKLFQWLASVAEWLTGILYKDKVKSALRQSLIIGTIKRQEAIIRSLNSKDLSDLDVFLNSMPDERLSYFRPHRFDHDGLKAVLASNAYMNYGLYVESELVGYALLKISPSRAAYIGLLIHPRFSGLELGKFLVAYLYWQASTAGLKTRSTISRHNPASLRSHEAVAYINVVSDLPNDYMLIELPRVNPPKPVLDH